MCSSFASEALSGRGSSASCASAKCSVTSQCALSVRQKTLVVRTEKELREAAQRGRHVQKEEDAQRAGLGFREGLDHVPRRQFRVVQVALRFRNDALERVSCSKRSTIRVVRRPLGRASIRVSGRQAHVLSLGVGQFDLLPPQLRLQLEKRVSRRLGRFGGERRPRTDATRRFSLFTSSQNAARRAAAFTCSAAEMSMMRGVARPSRRRAPRRKRLPAGTAGTPAPPPPRTTAAPRAPAPAGRGGRGRLRARAATPSRAAAHPCGAPRP